MVEYMLQLDDIFSSLADRTRRDILRRVSHQELSVNQIAVDYDMSLAAVSKHLKILERAKLIWKHRRGKYYFVQAAPQALRTADDYLRQYEKLWNERFDRLDKLIEEGENGKS